MMDGEIGCTSKLGLGSTFWFELSLKKAEQGDTTPTRDEATDSDDGLDEDEIYKRNTKVRLLIAEDNPTNLLVARAVLRKVGYQIDTAANGLEAVHAIRAFSYDAILMDVAMPEMDGLEATAAIRALPGERSKVPIIAMTAHAMKGDREIILAAGMNDYLQKPVRRNHLIKTIEAWTTGRGNNPPDSIANIEDNGDVLVDELAIKTLGEDTDPSMIPTLVNSFLDDARSRVERINKAIETKDMDTLNFEAHTLGSSSATFGAMQLHKLARDVDAECGKGNNDRALEIGRAISDIAQKSFKAISDYKEMVSV